MKEHTRSSTVVHRFSGCAVRILIEMPQLHSRVWFRFRVEPSQTLSLETSILSLDQAFQLRVELHAMTFGLHC